jgi:hypothetical protein
MKLKRDLKNNRKRDSELELKECSFTFSEKNNTFL